MANIPFDLSDNQAKALFDLSEWARFQQLATQQQSRTGGMWEDYIEPNKEFLQYSNLRKFDSALYPNVSVEGRDLYRAGAAKMRWGDRPKFFKYLNAEGDIEDSWHMSIDSQQRFQREGWDVLGGREKQPVLYVPSPQVGGIPLDVRKDWNKLYGLDQNNYVPLAFQYAPNSSADTEIGITHPSFFSKPKQQLTAPLLPSQFDPRYYLARASINATNKEQMEAFSRYLTRGAYTPKDEQTLWPFLAPVEDREERLVLTRGRTAPETPEEAIRLAKKEWMKQRAWELMAKEAQAQYGRELVIDARTRDNPKLAQYLGESEQAARDARNVIPLIHEQDANVNRIATESIRPLLGRKAWQQVQEQEGPAAASRVFAAIKAQERYNNLLAQKPSGFDLGRGDLSLIEQESTTVGTGSPNSKGGRLGKLDLKAYLGGFKEMLTPEANGEGMLKFWSNPENVSKFKKLYSTNPEFAAAFRAELGGRVLRTAGKLGEIGAIATAPMMARDRLGVYVQDYYEKTGKDPRFEYSMGKDGINDLTGMGLVSGLENALDVATLGNYDSLTGNEVQIARKELLDRYATMEDAMKPLPAWKLEAIRRQAGIDNPVYNGQTFTRTTK